MRSLPVSLTAGGARALLLASAGSTSMEVTLDRGHRLASPSKQVYCTTIQVTGEIGPSTPPVKSKHTPSTVIGGKDRGPQFT